jgi:hypothetical protein
MEVGRKYPALRTKNQVETFLKPIYTPPDTHNQPYHTSQASSHDKQDGIPRMRRHLIYIRLASTD